MVIGGMIADAFGWRVSLSRGRTSLASRWPLIVFFVSARSPDVCAPQGCGAEACKSFRPPAAFKEISGIACLCLSWQSAARSAAFLSYGKATWTTIFFQRTHALVAG
jgi:hypothetical protein